MTIDIPAIYKSTYEHYQQAKNNIIAREMFEH